MYEISYNIRKYETKLIQKNYITNMKNQPKYLINGFKHMYDSFSNDDNHYIYEFMFPKFSRWDIFTDYLLMHKYIKTDKLRSYNIIHTNPQ